MKKSLEKSRLEILQDERDDAKTPEEFTKAQNAIDVYFIGEPNKRHGKKKRALKPRYSDEDDEWDGY